MLLAVWLIKRLWSKLTDDGETWWQGRVGMSKSHGDLWTDMRFALSDVLLRLGGLYVV